MDIGVEMSHSWLILSKTIRRKEIPLTATTELLLVYMHIIDEQLQAEMHWSGSKMWSEHIFRLRSNNLVGLNYQIPFQTSIDWNRFNRLKLVDRWILFLRWESIENSVVSHIGPFKISCTKNIFISCEFHWNQLNVRVAANAIASLLFCT